jgi:tetratricopeptide (TPR) repeat protein
LKYYTQFKSVYSIKKYLLFSQRVSYKFLAILGLILFLAECSVEKNTGTTRFYQGLTARYNIYFNGYESFKDGLAKISKGYSDDFSEMLRVFENSDPSTVSLCSSDMEKAIQKASKLISLKSITARPEFNSKKELSENESKLLEQKEFNEWVDDSYFLIAKARFYKHEFAESASLFSFCVAEANDPEIRAESSVWLARINSEKGSFVEAGRILNEIEINASSSKTLKTIYYTTFADMLIKQKKYWEAIDPLTTALQYISGKRARYRLTYLLAQLYEQTGDSGKAISLFRKVVKMNPPYDVEFNARINIAGVFDVNSGNPAEIKKELEKMLKDAKNKDFQDQIYYALGNLSKKEGKENEALEYYTKSASSSSVNQNQKGKSYLALAEYYYSKPDYMKAGRYYDSTVYFLDQKFPAYKDLQTKSQNLNSLIVHLNTIQVEDSLQKVAKMPANERDALISGIIDKIIKAESEGKTSEYADRSNIGQYYENERRFQDNIAQEGKWYFYNQTALTFGRTEFRRRWGERRLEDNWRRSNRNRVNIQQNAGQDENGKSQSDTAQAVMDYKKPEFYLKNLPINDSLLALSNEKIAAAYFNAGEVFSEKIADKQKAAESYETLLSRFPDNELVPESLYDLYKLYREGNSQKSEIARQRLLQNYPESEFSKIISDPDYYNKKMAALRLSEKNYENAYNLYTLGNYKESIAVCDSSIKNKDADNLAPKFMLLRAYSVAGMSDERSFKEELNRVIKAFPGTAEGKKASELIAYLNQKLPELKIEEDKEIAAEIYKADTTALYSFVIIIMDPAFNVNQASFDVISYNIDNYTNKNYRTEGILANNKYIKITVAGFADNNQAWEYYNSFKPEKHIRNASGAETMTFLINNENLKKLDEDKNPQRYNLFFKENYLTGKKNR